MICLINKAV